MSATLLPLTIIPDHRAVYPTDCKTALCSPSIGFHNAGACIPTKTGKKHGWFRKRNIPADYHRINGQLMPLN